VKSLSAGALALALFWPFCALPATAQSVHVIKGSPAQAVPKTSQHSAFTVEVNAAGQVVRVKSASASKNDMFNAETFGNVSQIFIRRPDGSAVAGLYRVSYDYDPKTHRIARGIKLISAGGSWAHEEGAANRMRDRVRRQQAAAAQAKARARAGAGKLPDLNTSVTPTPTDTPKH